MQGTLRLPCQPRLGRVRLAWSRSDGGWDAEMLRPDRGLHLRCIANYKRSVCSRARPHLDRIDLNGESRTVLLNNELPLPLHDLALPQRADRIADVSFVNQHRFERTATKRPCDTPKGRQENDVPCVHTIQLIDAGD